MSKSNEDEGGYNVVLTCALQDHRYLLLHLLQSPEPLVSHQRAGAASVGKNQRRRPNATYTARFSFSFTARTEAHDKDRVKLTSRGRAVVTFG